MTPAEMIDKFVKIRDHKKKATEEFEQTMKPVNDALEKLEGLILDALNVGNLESIKSEFGTAYRTTHSTTSVKDRDAFLTWVRQNNAYEALDVKANKTFVKEFMEGSGPIPGVEMSSMQKVGVRRAS